MDATDLAVQFIMQGYAVVPDVVVGAELEAMRDAFERLASRLGKRAFTPAEIEAAPELVNFIGHPRVMPVIEAYMGYFGHEPAIAWLHLWRDIINPILPSPPPFDIVNDAKNRFAQRCCERSGQQTFFSCAGCILVPRRNKVAIGIIEELSTFQHRFDRLV